MALGVASATLAPHHAQGSTVTQRRASPQHFGAGTGSGLTYSCCLERTGPSQMVSSGGPCSESMALLTPDQASETSAYLGPYRRSC